MKNFLKKFSILILLLSSVIACGSLCKCHNSNEEGEKMFAVTLTYNSRQLDSICVADTLITDIEKWLKSSYVDYETGKRTVKYTYIKRPNTKNEVTYVLVPIDTLYQITKRTIVK